MKLEPYLRSEVNQKIRPLFLKDECEHCGCTEDLHLHHQYEFFKIVDDVLNKLQLEMKDTEEYTECELYLIKSCVLAEHLKDNYLTLCSECHKKEHEHKEIRKHDKKNNKLSYQERKKNENLKIINEYLDKELTTQDVKEIIKRCKWYSTDKRKLLSVNNSKEKFKEFGYVLEEKYKSKHHRRKIFTIKNGNIN